MIRYLLLGTLFGFVLSRTGATDAELIVQMFLFEDLHLMGVIGVAVVVAAVGLALAGRGMLGDTAPPARKPLRPARNILGGVVFGAGWALTGTCPGTGLAQIGEGQTLAVFTVAGMVLGAWAYRFVAAPRALPEAVVVLAQAHQPVDADLRVGRLDGAIEAAVELVEA